MYICIPLLRYRCRCCIYIYKYYYSCYWCRPSYRYIAIAISLLLNRGRVTSQISCTGAIRLTKALVWPWSVPWSLVKRLGVRAQVGFESGFFPQWCHCGLSDDDFTISVVPIRRPRTEATYDPWKLPTFDLHATGPR